MQRRVVILVNRKAGRGLGRKRLGRYLDQFKKADLHCDVTSDVEEAFCLVEQASRQGCLQSAVAAGGDGTAALLAARLPPRTPLALFPLGTENLLSRYLGVRRNPVQAAAAVVDGRECDVDSGRAGQRLFLLMCSIGLDAEIVHRVHAARRGPITHLAYLAPSLASVGRFQYPPLHIQSDDLSEPLVGRWVFIFNAPRYAGGLPLAPHADPTDGLLDVYVFHQPGLMAGLNYLQRILRGIHTKRDGCTHFRTRRLHVECDRPAPVQCDGDPCGFTPLHVELELGRVRLLSPLDGPLSERTRNNSPASTRRTPTPRYE